MSRPATGCRGASPGLLAQVTGKSVLEYTLPVRWLYDLDCTTYVAGRSPGSAPDVPLARLFQWGFRPSSHRSPPLPHSPKPAL